MRSVSPRLTASTGEGSTATSRRLLFLIFTASGFAGLIYESIWTHYLKLFLGHAAYAQTLVLAIFMGGMALGAWLCSRYSERWRHLLLAYALAEGVIGLLALAFHPLFSGFMNLAYDSLIPALGSPAGVSAFKWLAAGLFILPQSVLLGMTFPLMATGVMRRFPGSSGATVSMLYFTNSIGAAIGVLASGFILIGWVGLPGTMMVAGLINILLAATVWLLVRRDARVRGAQTRAPEATPDAGPAFRVFLFASFLTGMASFMYEIGWIRMLSLVLGSTTYSFELMLSAFITGLALGGLAIRKRIDRLANPVMALALVQVAMGTMALLTLPMYGSTFEVMQWLIQNLDKTDAGYGLFHLSSHAIALAIMLPTTFCAGMTLPLITNILLQRRHGERSVGAVYAWNTLGAIAGVFLSVHLVMPGIGLKGLIALGAAFDIALGLALAWWISTSVRAPAWLTACGAGALIAVFLVVQLDPLKMSSGVYIGGELPTPADQTILYQMDGKTASVSVARQADGQVVSIATNGKVDAGMNVRDARRHTADEPTMVLAGALPLILHPQTRLAANIGMGSGLTTSTMLISPRLERLDTIEIEPAMVQGANHFRPRVDRAFDDPRSHIHIEDAKTYFSTHNRKYDVIVSEPSNPWVSGVASLFSREFYQLIKRHLNREGLFVQWLQLYDIDMNMVASVIKAISSEFRDYAIYASNDADILIVARADGMVPLPSAAAFAESGLKGELELVSIQAIQDVELRWIGGKGVLDPLFDSYAIAYNSDYYPVLDLNSERTRFFAVNAGELIGLALADVPVVDMLSRRPASWRNNPPNFDDHLPMATNATLAAALSRYVLEGEWNADGMQVPDHVRVNADMARQVYLGCDAAIPKYKWIGALSRSIAPLVLPYVPAADLEPFWRRMESDACRASMPPFIRDYVSLLRAVSERDGPRMAALARQLLRNAESMPQGFVRYFVSAGILGNLAAGDRAAARQLWRDYRELLSPQATASLVVQLLVAHSFESDTVVASRANRP